MVYVCESMVYVCVRACVYVCAFAVTCGVCVCLMSCVCVPQCMCVWYMCVVCVCAFDPFRSFCLPPKRGTSPALLQGHRIGMVSV